MLLLAVCRRINVFKLCLLFKEDFDNLLNCKFPDNSGPRPPGVAGCWENYRVAAHLLNVAVLGFPEIADVFHSA